MTTAAEPDGIVAQPPTATTTHSIHRRPPTPPPQCIGHAADGALRAFRPPVPFRIAARRSRIGALRLVPQNARPHDDEFANCNRPVDGIAGRVVRLVAKQQTAALAATLVDYAVMTACVSGGGMNPALATACGALVGMFVGFVLGRRWVFAATGASAVGQVWRYLAVSLVSLVANAGGEAALVGAGLHYLAARPIISTTVGLGWNLPMQQFFVFRRRR